jgi:hypothetical protein
MSTTIDSAVEQLTIELPASVVSALRAEAEQEGRDVSSIAAERLANIYAIATNESTPLDALDYPEAVHAALHGPAQRFDPEAIHNATSERYGSTNLSHLSKEELQKHTEEVFSRIDPDRLAEAERLGLV